ncbi:hypothetical protein MFLO_05335 [Listeria floridensis FSL S10-1187]|uniref:Uncharacterized protein n=1 Tax=Listeria floridensis FSL S10-1187 TaxID=1265817 RepID=A0ABN0RGH9_9LIST|nr:hypothetical protein [Listeria floridensis]EUJ33010.1 hypothetical protein MFLO_05335 [Listeria floridensis FSL S10-1187]
MKDEGYIVEGKIYNLSFDEKNMVRGWLLLVIDSNEYLIRQNSTLLGIGIFKIRRKIYQADIELKNHRINGKKVARQEKNRAQKKNIGIGIGIALSALLAYLVPTNWLWGSINYPVSIVSGLINIIIVWAVLLLCFKCLSIYRKEKFVKQVEKLNGQLLYKGSGCLHSFVNQKQTDLKISKFSIFIGFLIFFCTARFLIVCFTFYCSRKIICFYYCIHYSASIF